MKLRPRGKMIAFCVLFVALVFGGWKVGLFDEGTTIPIRYDAAVQEMP